MNDDSEDASGLPEGQYFASWEPQPPFSLSIHNRVDHEQIEPLADDFRAVQRIGTVLQFDALQDNLSRWTALQRSAKNRLPREPADRVPIDQRRTSTRVLVELSNTLTSAMAFLDARKVDTEGVFGKQSEEYVSLQTLLRSHFDASFAYRLCTKLRNVLVHAGRAPFSITESLDPGGTRQFAITACPEALLAASDRWGAPVTRDLRAMTEDVDIVAAIDELAGILTTIEQECIRLHLGSAKAAAARLLRTFEREGLAGTTHAVAVVTISLAADGTCRLSGLESVSPAELSKLASMNIEDLKLTRHPLPDVPRVRMTDQARAAMQAHLTDDADGVTAAVRASVTDPRTAAETIMSLCALASVGLHEVESVLGLPALKQLNELGSPN